MIVEYEYLTNMWDNTNVPIYMLHVIIESNVSEVLDMKPANNMLWKEVRETNER